MHRVGSKQQYAPGDLAGLDSRYEVKEYLDRGGMSVVYKARDKVLDRLVAIKTIKTTRLEQKQMVAFQAEAKAISSLTHERILRVLDFGIMKDGQPYLVLDFLEGQTLFHHIKRNGALDLFNALRVIAQVCEAVSHAHTHGVVHRDLKSTNIMLSSNFSASVFDFGIAVVMENPSRGVTLTPAGSIVGSPAYMSPEQIMQKRLDVRTDVYSLGCVLFEAVTGRRPFISESSLEVMHQHLNNAPPLVTAKYCRLDLLPSLNNIIQQALQKLPDDRYQSIDEMREDILELMEQLERCSLTRIHVEPERSDLLEKRTNQKESQVIRLDAHKTRRANLISLAFVLSVLLAVSTVVGAMTFKESWDLMTKPAPRESVPPRYHSVNIDRNDMSDLLINSAESAWSETRFHELAFDLEKFPPETRIVDLSHTDLRNVDLAPLSKLKNLQTLDVWDSNLPSESLRSIAKIESLRNLNCSKNIGLQPSDFGALKTMNKLNRLTVDHCCLTDEHVKAICEIKSLRQLRLDWNPCLTGASIEMLATTFPNLESIDIGGCGLKSANLVPLAKLQRLAGLKLDYSHYGDKDVELVSRFSNVVTLSISYTDFSKDGIVQVVTKLKKLKSLKICGTNLSETDLDTLQATFPNLRIVSEFQL